MSRAVASKGAFPSTLSAGNSAIIWGVAEEDVRRRIEGMVAREKGRLREEMEAEIERRITVWRAELESGKRNIKRELSEEKKEKRRRLQKEHQRRKRAERQATRRHRSNGWAAVGRHVVFGQGPASFDSIINAGHVATTTQEPEIMEEPDEDKDAQI